MVKSFAITVTAVVMSFLPACNPGDGSVQGCATALYGTYTRTDAEGFGVINGDFLDGAEIEVTFIRTDNDDTPDDYSDNPVRVTYIAVDADGTATPSVGGAMQLANVTMDLDTCEASGDWDYFAGTEVGTWSIGRYEPFGF